jgi:hypothetical protein
MMRNSKFSRGKKENLKVVKVPRIYPLVLRYNLKYNLSATSRNSYLPQT